MPDYNYKPDNDGVTATLGDWNRHTWAALYAETTAPIVVPSFGYVSVFYGGSASKYSGMYSTIVGFRVGTLPAGPIMSAKIRVMGQAANTYTGTVPSARWICVSPSASPTINDTDWKNWVGGIPVTDDNLFSDMVAQTWHEFPITDITCLVPDKDGYIWFYCIDNYSGDNVTPPVLATDGEFDFSFQTYEDDENDAQLVISTAPLIIGTSKAHNLSGSSKRI
jgi:hypothetical protein